MDGILGNLPTNNLKLILPSKNKTLKNPEIILLCNLPLKKYFYFKILYYTILVWFENFEKISQNTTLDFLVKYIIFS